MQDVLTNQKKKEKTKPKKHKKHKKETKSYHFLFISWKLKKLVYICHYLSIQNKER